MQVGSYFPNITNKVKKKICEACVSFDLKKNDTKIKAKEIVEWTVIIIKTTSQQHSIL